MAVGQQYVSGARNRVLGNQMMYLTGSCQLPVSSRSPKKPASGTRDSWIPGE